MGGFVFICSRVYFTDLLDACRLRLGFACLRQTLTGAFNSGFHVPTLGLYSSVCDIKVMNPKRTSRIFEPL